MNKEIEEIISIKKDCDYKRISVDELLVLKDYITKLQKDNEYLNKCNIELARRNTKAIEYLREIEMFERKFGFDGVRRKKLLDILQGSDKE